MAVYDKALLLRSLRCAYPRATLLASYAVGHRTGENERHGWVGALTWAHLRELFDTLGLALVERSLCLAGQHCMRLVPQPAVAREICAGFPSK